MKQVFVLFSICILLLASETILAQTASDYYLPLSVGSHVKLSTVSVGTVDNHWAPRISTYTIEGTDLISGQQYFREVDRDMASSFSDIFQALWLRKDSGGNVAVGAVASGQQGIHNVSTNIDSATVMSGYLFPNEFLTKGYSKTYPSDGGVTMKETVLSVTETVSVSAGTFYNCIKISNTNTDNTGTLIFCEYDYYARGIGLIKDERTLPISDIHTDELIEYSTTGVNDAVIKIPQIFSLSQNYPNPFNPTTTINYSVPKSGFVTIKVYDLLGREAAILVNEQKNAGNYEAKLNGSNLSSGVYLYQLRSGSFLQTKKLVLMK